VASRVCWYCDTKAHMTMIEASVRIKTVEHVSQDNEVVQAAFVCDECKIVSLGLQERRDTGYSGSTAKDFLEEHESLIWLPAHGTGRTFDDVPEHIADAAAEAYATASIGAYRAAALMARSVVEATAKNKGITSGNLQGKIDTMRERDLIREHVKEAAHEIRHLGNDMAHGDFVQPTEKEEAEEVLDLMAEILHEVFQAPAKIEARKAARLAKKEQAKPG
jgi:hypothetical protein